MKPTPTARRAHLLQPLSLTLALGLAFAAPSLHAQSLVDLYESARVFDATYLSAKALDDSSSYKAAQAGALMLPGASLAVSSTRSQLSADGLPSDRTFGGTTATLSGRQPLYNPANKATIEQANRGALVSKEQLTQAGQDLIIRVSQAYFDVLGARDSLTFVKAQKAAVAEQLASAKRNFEVGTSTITDTREAQARYDLVIAQEIAAENDLRIKKIALDTLVGKTETDPKPLKAPVLLPALQPGEVAAWVTRSESGHPAVRQAEIGLEVAKLETQKAQAGHKPTVDVIGSYGKTFNAGTSVNTGDNSKSSVGTVGLSMNVPIFAGFSVQNRIKETVLLEEKARNDLEGAKRSVAQATRTAFFGVLSGQGQVKALEAAEISTQSALDANKLGYQVGVRINIDVLNSQSQLFQTKRDLAKARYDVLVGELRLRQAAGTLAADDLKSANALLVK